MHTRDKRARVVQRGTKVKTVAIPLQVKVGGNLQQIKKKNAIGNTIEDRTDNICIQHSSLSEDVVSRAVSKAFAVFTQPK